VMLPGLRRLFEGVVGPTHGLLPIALIAPGYAVTHVS
jgi:hypothetical protein